MMISIHTIFIKNTVTGLFSMVCIFRCKTIGSKKNVSLFYNYFRSLKRIPS